MLPLIRVASCLILAVVFSFLVSAQFPTPPPNPDNPPDTRLPNGRSQKDEMLKADHARNIEDARELVKLAEELNADLEKNTQYVFSIASVKKTEEIEKLARKIRSRMKRN
jgi:hypothetical protein